MKMFLVCSSNFYYKNKIFDINSIQNRDNAYYPFYLLKQKLIDENIELNTYDYLNKNLDIKYSLLFFDIPNNINKILGLHSNIPKFLILFETEIVRPLNWEKKLHDCFEKIFTWRDDLVDNKKYFKLNYPNVFSASISIDIGKKENFCTIIAGNKKSSHPLELYSRRIEAIRWFERYHPADFDLYGVGWDEYRFDGPKIVCALNRIKLLTKLLPTYFPSYKGKVDIKKEVLQKYKFSICYENARDIPGYITEKIFDCFFAGCVPIYWGANNVTDHIPKECFIDKREFESYEKLYEFIKNMDDKTYLSYRENIQSYLSSPMSYEFTAECFAKTIVEEILNG